MESTLIAVYCVVDDFCKEFLPAWHKMQIETGQHPRRRKANLSPSETITIVIAFHSSGFKCIKHFYKFICESHSSLFPNLVSYNRFVELEKSVIFPLLAFFDFLKGPCTGTSFLDSTAIPVCHNKRISSHKLFSGIAKRGKTTMGWFYGFKLHLITNEYGHPIAFDFTPGNVDDRKVKEHIFNNVYGKIFGDKGYISKNFFEQLFKKGIQLVTALRNNMKPQIMTQSDSHTLNQRSYIESVFNVLKNNMTLTHTRHRSIPNFLVNIVATLCCYSMKFNKQFIRLKNNLLPINS